MAVLTLRPTQCHLSTYMCRHQEARLGVSTLLSLYTELLVLPYRAHHVEHPMPTAKPNKIQKNLTKFTGAYQGLCQHVKRQAHITTENTEEHARSRVVRLLSTHVGRRTRHMIAHNYGDNILCKGRLVSSSVPSHPQTQFDVNREKLRTYKASPIHTQHKGIWLRDRAAPQLLLTHLVLLCSKNLGNKGRCETTDNKFPLHWMKEMELKSRAATQSRSEQETLNPNWEGH
jgi:hypothetical protein